MIDTMTVTINANVKKAVVYGSDQFLREQNRIMLVREIFRMITYQSTTGATQKSTSTCQVPFLSGHLGRAGQGFSVGAPRPFTHLAVNR